MFEDIQKHRQAVRENIEKSLQIGYTESEDFEKAHKVGDIHPNGKWVWTQLPSGKFDWRVIKVKPQANTSGGSGIIGKTAPSNAVQNNPSLSAKQIKSNKKLLNDYKEYIDEQVSKRGNSFKENVAYIVYEYDKEPVEDENGDWVKDGNEFDPEHPYNFDVEEVEAFDTLAEAKKYLKKNSGNYYRGKGISCMISIQEWDKRYNSWGDEEIDHAYSATENGARLKLIKQLNLD